MTTQLLIYQSAVPVTREAHGTCSIDTNTNFLFSAAVNSVPLMAVEFPAAANEYPIVFGGTGDDIAPAVILGMRGDENLFLTGDGHWAAKYIPAFVRRYPFVFTRSGDDFVLCIDESHAGFNREGRGHRLFADDGAPTPYVTGVMQFLQDYQNQHVTTQRFCARIQALGLLEPMQAQVTLSTGPQISLSGFQAVNRDRLKALPGETLAELAKSDELELLYLHLHSMRNFDGMRDRLAARVASVAASNGAGAALS